MRKPVILSPHLDDGVFSCWHELITPGARLVTVFAGLPPEGTTTLWDRICGTASSRDMLTRRIEENNKAIAGLNVQIVNLNFLDHQYRKQPLVFKEIVDQVIKVSDKDSEFFVPLSIGRLWRHPDHRLVRDVGIFLSREGRKVSFYLDIPYMQIPARNLENYKHRLPKRADNLLGKTKVIIHELSTEEQARKSKAMAAYATQFNMTNLVAFGTLKRGANLKREMTLSRI